MCIVDSGMLTRHLTHGRNNTFDGILRKVPRRGKLDHAKAVFFGNRAHGLHGVISALDPAIRAIGPVIAGTENVTRLHAASYTHLRAHETVLDLVCRLLLEKKKLRD